MQIGLSKTVQNSKESQIFLYEKSMLGQNCWGLPPLIAKFYAYELWVGFICCNLLQDRSALALITGS